MSYSQLSNDDGNHNDDDYNVDDDAGCSRKSGPTVKYVKYEENIEAKDNVSTVVDGMYLNTVYLFTLKYTLYADHNYYSNYYHYHGNVDGNEALVADANSTTSSPLSWCDLSRLIKDELRVLKRWRREN